MEGGDAFGHLLPLGGEAYERALVRWHLNVERRKVSKYKRYIFQVRTVATSRLRFPLLDMEAAIDAKLEGDPSPVEFVVIVSALFLPAFGVCPTVDCTWKVKLLTFVYRMLTLMLTPRRTRHRRLSRPHSRSRSCLNMAWLNRPIPAHTTLRTRSRRRCRRVHTTTSMIRSTRGGRRQRCYRYRSMRMTGSLRYLLCGRRCLMVLVVVGSIKILDITTQKTCVRMKRRLSMRKAPIALDLNV